MHTRAVVTRYRTNSVSLVVDDFGVECEQKKNAYYLLDALNVHYDVDVEDWEGKIFCAINMECDYKQMTLYINITGYSEKVIHKYQHTTYIRQ